MNPPGSHDNDDAAALQGATLAFGPRSGKLVKPVPLPQKPNGAPRLGAPRPAVGSPSLIAATLAASRSASPSPKTGTPRVPPRDAALMRASQVPDATALDAAACSAKSLAALCASAQAAADEVPPRTQHVDETSQRPAKAMPKPTPTPKPAWAGISNSGSATSAEWSGASRHGETMEPAGAAAAHLMPASSPRELPRARWPAAASQHSHDGRPRQPPVLEPRLPAPGVPPKSPAKMTRYGLPASPRRPSELSQWLGAAASPAHGTPQSSPKQGDAVRTEHPPAASPASVATPASKPQAGPTPPSLSQRPLISRSTPSLVSPRPIRISKPVLEPPHREAASAIASPSTSRSPPRSGGAAAKRPPTPPKPRGGSMAPGGRARPLAESRRPPSADRRAPPDHEQSKEASAQPRIATGSGWESSDESFVSASCTPSPRRRTPPPRPRSAASTTRQPVRQTPRQRAKVPAASLLPVDSLTSAIVAGSLASSRLGTSSTRPPRPPPGPPPRSPHLPHTLRKPEHESDDEYERHMRKHHHSHYRQKLRSGKHAHHEGSRKRWRESMTEAERKRYESLWASNRGLHVDPQNGGRIAGGGANNSGSGSSRSRSPHRDGSEYVSNLVVREIWRRSRLPNDELAEVWNLVDRGGRGVLTREEFVVGMWLLDQRLRGRKVPTKVSDSVWASASGLRLSRKPPKK